MEQPEPKRANPAEPESAPPRSGTGRGPKKNSSPPPTLERFTADLAHSGLVEPARVRQRLEEFQNDRSGQTPTSERFARYLVAKNDLTRFQARRLLAGETDGFFLGGCRILEQIGAGGMGMVFLAEQTRLGRKVALKVLPQHRSLDERQLARFEREARAAATLKHPSIVQIYDVGHENNTHFIVMEFVQGQDLCQYLGEHGAMPVEQSLAVAAQVAAGLQHAHEHGIVHRDIKPSNLILEGNRIRILDLGLARRVGADEGVTMDGSTVGTPDYMSPEQCTNGRSVDVRSDLYSLGCTWYHLLAGRPPFAGGTVYSKVMSHVQEPVPSLSELVPQLPVRVVEIIEKLLQKQPEQRYQTPQELLDDLVAVAANSGTATSAPAQAPLDPQGQLRTRSVARDQTHVSPLADDESVDDKSPRPRGSGTWAILIPTMIALALGGIALGMQLSGRGKNPNRDGSLPAGIPAGREPLAQESPASQTVADTGSETPLNNEPPPETDPGHGPAANAQNDLADADRQTETDKPESPPESAEEDDTNRTAAVVTQTEPSQPALPRVTSAHPEGEPTRTWIARSTTELADFWSQIGNGDTIELVGGQTYSVASTRLEGMRLTLQADDSGRRPVIALECPPDLPPGEAILNLRDTALSIAGVDLSANVADHPVAGGNLVLFGLERSVLELDASSITIVRGKIDNRSPVTAIAAYDEREGTTTPAGAITENQVAFRDSLVRGAHTVVYVGSRAARVTFENSILCGPGELLHTVQTRSAEAGQQQRLVVELHACVADFGGPLFTRECRPASLLASRLEITVHESFLTNTRSTADLPPQVFWQSAIDDRGVSSALSWTAEKNVYLQRSDGLRATTDGNQIAIIVQTPDDWRLQSLGSELGARQIRAANRRMQSPWHQRVPEDYRFAADAGIVLGRVPKPAKPAVKKPAHN